MEGIVVVQCTPSSGGVGGSGRSSGGRAGSHCGGRQCVLSCNCVGGGIGGVSGRGGRDCFRGDGGGDGDDITTLTVMNPTFSTRAPPDQHANS